MATRKPSKGKSRKKPHKSERPLIISLARLCLVAGIWMSLVVGLIVAWYAAELPGIIDDPHFERKYAVTVQALDGSTIARYGELKGVSIGVEDLPPHLIYAVLAIEDRRFYSHLGIDPVGIARALYNNLTSNTRQGGSTITQQLAKNLFLTPEQKLKRKIQEAILALWLETQLTKDEILSAYLNRVYLGAGAYGIEAASRVYFNKSAKELTLQESAIIAGLLKAPSRYSPQANPQRSAERAKVVIASMKDAGFITEEEAQNSTLRLDQETRPVEGTGERFYSDWIVSDLTTLTGELPSDMVIETTMIPEIQKVAEEAVKRVLDESGEAKKASQAAVVVMDTDGAVLAMVGGRDYRTSQFNRATDALRAPGSSFKPIVYLTALEQGMRPSDMVVDEPVKYGRYRPTNFKNEYFGEVPMEFALARSLNTVAVQLAYNAGVGNVIDTARRLGVKSELQHDLSIALGSSGVPIIEMATAYASIARGGFIVVPYGIIRIKDTAGRLVYERAPFASERRIASEQSIANLIYMMEGVVQTGTGQGAAIAGYRIAGKTGTSQDFRDAWFIGFSGNLICAVWVGNDDNSSMKAVTGGSLPAAIWRETMTTALRVAAQRNTLKPMYSNRPAMNGIDGLINRLLAEPATNQ
ncbi:MAG: PBP1A family penicillin-binding protein [Micavibrio aeruginosavorus]|uniref:PBP1A family penicillin-binding protein n=1 Tax=Micavibrio aeruginosavorus TaxID=349221 RepID=A0A7T5R424_9BACT|nr:MAG: PBP1A family penicillin-binding protein [Micavibrio aeruginosavorus]